MAAASDMHDPVSFPGSGVIVRPALGAGLAFMEAARNDALGIADLGAWLHRSLVEPGYIPMPAAVHEPGIAPVPLGDVAAPGHAAAYEARAKRVVSTARVRVAMVLGGLVARPADDRFLAAAIFAGRVQRVRAEHASVWQPRPGKDDRLSDVVLSLFTADILDHRDDYDAQLGVCQICGRVFFAFDVVVRDRCAQHDGS